MQFRTPPKNNTNKNIEKEFKNLRKELLDLTLRNPLLNFKARNRNLNIINQSPINVYRTLVLENKKMFFSANKKETKKSKAHAFIDQTREFLSQESDKTLKADLSPSELQKRLFYIDQQSKTMVQEQGYNILYVAIGFIEWVDKKKPRQKNLAPLILIPVEMERKKVGNSFSLSWTGEDLQNNISIQAKLREAGIELPKFEQTSYVEGVNHYLENVRKAIRPFSKWDVKYDIALGFFSFTKFVMYNDLNPESWDDNIDLTENELIQAIFNPSKNVYDDTFEEDDVDEKLHYKTMYQVLDADSSQIAVIENVKAGHNLVVEGPPGTGKSQTIVNLIAELIAEGKTVLFVSEKMAALEVVKSRLDSVGLGKFVLELHSHKTRRKKLLKNLQKATNVRSTRDLKLDQTLRKLENLRNQLDEYAEIIHQPIAKVNLSPFELYGMKESSEDYFSRQNRLLPLVRFNNSEDLSMKDLDDIILSLENLSELYSTISKNNPWSYCNPKSLLPADLREIEQLIRDSLESLNDFRYEMNIINEVYGIKVPDTLQEYEDSITALDLLNSPALNLIDSSILLNREWFNDPDKALHLIKLLSSYQQSSNLFDKFTDYLLIADLDTLIHDLNKDLNKKFRLFGGNSHKDELSRLYKGNVPSEKEALNDLIKIRGEINVRQSFNDNEELAVRYFGDLWSKKADVKELKEVSLWMRKFTNLLSNGTFNENTVKMLSNDLFHPSIDDGINDYMEKGNKFYDALKKLESKLNPRSKIIFKKESEDVPFEKWEIQLNKWKGQLSSLHLWSQYSNTKRACIDTPASIFIKTVEKRNIKKDDVKPLVLGNFADSLLNIVFAQNEVLAGFIGELHENRIAEFKDLDKKIINLNRKRIFNKLNSQIPKIFGGANDPEAKVLAGEFTRKSGHLPVRTLLEKAGGTIKKIKPVFMMSPLSIAQYLDPTNPKLQFDVVIFDEASQVKPEDALGAFMRGKTAVVMGDTQQLPPTSFFDQMTDSESGEEVATALDMESILHLCKLSFPVKMLKWHYRSRHESLINISNREFYDNELLVYPSPCHNDPELGLKFHYHPDTAYHRGEGSANPKEAKYVVKEIFRHFEKYGDKKSLGVGTFSVAQKNAILEELEIERKSHPEYEPLFSDKREERFFVKNLETIQGDERDVILISVGYGYDTEGKMSLNFGPLNQDGGERRLNVLITRAREKCVVFTNFRAHDIHLTANPPFGVKSLQSFLEYAENLSLNHFIAEEDYDEAPFEDAIYNFLVDNGYQVDKKIGCAGFRVDLAIIDEDNPGKYLLGIQCDGHNYASSKVARDRDRLREQVLEGLGWNIFHIWSTDWYRNRDLARTRLLEHIEDTIVSTKVNDLKVKIKDAESMKINPITTVVLGGGSEEKKSHESEEVDIEDDSSPIDEEKQDLINKYLQDLDDELNGTKDKSSENEDDFDIDEKDLIDESIESIKSKGSNDSNSVSDEDDDIDLEEDSDYMDEDSESDNYSDLDGSSNLGEDSESYNSSDLDGSSNLDEDSESDNYSDLEGSSNLDEDSDSDSNSDLKKDSDTSDDYHNSGKYAESDSFDDDSIDSSNKNIYDEAVDDETNLETNLNSNNKSKNKLNDIGLDNNKSEEFKVVNNNSENNKSIEDRESRPKQKNTSILNRLKNIGEGFVITKSDGNYENNKNNENKETNEIDDAGEPNKIIESDGFDKFNEADIEFIKAEELKSEEFIRDSNKDFNKEVQFDEGKNQMLDDSKENQSESDIKFSKVNSKTEELINQNNKTMEELEEYINNFNNSNNSNKFYNSNQQKINEESEDIENMRQDNNVSKRRGNQEIIDDSSDVIVPISAEKRVKERESYLNDTDVIIPIQNEYGDEDKITEELEDLISENIDGISVYPNDRKDYSENINNKDDSIDSNDFNESKNSSSESIQETSLNHDNDYAQRADSHDYEYAQGVDGSDYEYAQGVDGSDYGYAQGVDGHDYDHYPAKDDDSYYYSAVGIENSLKKNAVHYPKSNNRNKKGIVGAVSSLKDEMLYINASLKEIENPSEREKIYTIDPTDEADYSNEYDSRYYNDDISKNKDRFTNKKQYPEYDDVYEESISPEEHFVDSDKFMESSVSKTPYSSHEVHIESAGNGSESESESLFNSKKHQYLDKIEEYTSESAYIETEEDFISNDLEYSNEIAESKYSDTQETYRLENEVSLFDSSDNENISLIEDDIDIDDDEFEHIIDEVDQDYQEIEKERIIESNVLSSVDNTRLTPTGKLEDYIVPYEEIEDVIIKSATEIYDDEKKLATAVMDIVSAEGPIHIDIVIRRIRESCRLSRAGTKFKEAIFKAIDRNESHMNLIREDDFLFIDYDQIKVRKREKPNIDLISNLEIEKSIDLVLSFEKSLKVKELAKMVSRTFGFRSTSKKTSNKIIEVIDIMIGKGILINNNDKIEFR